jgi:hypothetical protein
MTDVARKINTFKRKPKKPHRDLSPHNTATSPHNVPTDTQARKEASKTISGQAGNQPWTMDFHIIPQMESENEATAISMDKRAHRLGRFERGGVS